MMLNWTGISIRERERELHNTRKAMVTSSLHVQGSQVQSHVTQELKEAFTKLLSHHGVLCVELCLTAHQTTNHWVDATYRQTQKVGFEIVRW